MAQKHWISDIARELVVNRPVVPCRDGQILVPGSGEVDVGIDAHSGFSIKTMQHQQVLNCLIFAGAPNHTKPIPGQILVPNASCSSFVTLVLCLSPTRAGPGTTTPWARRRASCSALKGSSKSGRRRGTEATAGTAVTLREEEAVMVARKVGDLRIAIG